VAEATQLDSADRTPGKVLDGMLAAHKPYKRDDCNRDDDGALKLIDIYAVRGAA